jgi:hypothetical protein
VLIEFDHRESNSPFVERIWRSRSRQGGLFLRDPRIRALLPMRSKRAD